LILNKYNAPRTLVIASHNKGKVKEIKDLLIPLKIEVFSANELMIPEPEETANTFNGNSELKAMASAKASNLPSLADDSGLVIDALNGQPGIYSARWAGPKKDFTIAIKKVHEALRKVDREKKEITLRSARFVCSLALAWPDGKVAIFEGTIEGTICWPPRGNMGFGYDPIFVPIGHEKSFGEVDPEWKNSISHRAEAFSKFLTHIYGKTND
jgi:XTP/dITP diphosphohydrolase